jgi:hypothetical protein
MHQYFRLLDPMLQRHNGVAVELVQTELVEQNPPKKAEVQQAQQEQKQFLEQAVEQLAFRAVHSEMN